jgi:hypothetical protein
MQLSRVAVATLSRLRFRLQAIVCAHAREAPARDDVQASRAQGAVLSIRLAEAGVSRSLADALGGRPYG